MARNEIGPKTGEGNVECFDHFLNHELVGGCGSAEFIDPHAASCFGETANLVVQTASTLMGSAVDADVLTR